MRAIVLLLVLIFGIGISFGQTNDEGESDKLIVTITDENGNIINLPSIPHVKPIVTEDSPPPPNSDIESPTNLIIDNTQNYE